MLKAVMFEFGHTIIDELKDRHVPIVSRAARLMPGLPDILPQINYRMGIWANADAGEQDLRIWLRGAAINDYFEWVITSEDAGARKPSLAFFSYALERCKLRKDEIIFVGNQRNTDIRGANDYGIECIWLSGAPYRSPDDDPDDAPAADKARPTHVVDSLEQLPALLDALSMNLSRQSAGSRF